jgi:hypothetical protein
VIIGELNYSKGAIHMVQIIAGTKGKGKTKILLDKVNTKVKESSGTLVYLDKNSKHMYELDRKVRLINVNEYCVTNYSEFIGFLCGMISQDHDLEVVYLDSFLSLACIENTDVDVTPIIEKIDMISAKFNVDFVISMSKDKSQLSESVAQKVIVAL